MAPGIPGIDGIDLWLVPIPDAPCRERDEALAASLTPPERERLGRYRAESARLQFLFARSALKGLLARYLPDLPPARLRLVEGRFGKPRLADGPPLAFNVSHTDGLAAIAFSAGAPIGVDVERRRTLPTDASALFRQCLSEAESRRLQGLDTAAREMRFHETWTLKEAYLKALGVGLKRDMRGVELVFDDRDALVSVRDRAGVSGPWRFVHASHAGERLALAAAMPRRADASRELTVAIREYRLDGRTVTCALPLTVRDLTLVVPRESRD